MTGQLAPEKTPFIQEDENDITPGVSGSLKRTLRQ